MTCPLRSMGNTNCSCDKGGCAWWNPEKEQCCMVIIAENIDDMVKGQRIIYTREI